jgi:hypothetical protein
MRCEDLPGDLDDRRPRDRKAVDVTTHLRARAVQAGALLALVGGVLAVASSPALADDPDVQIQNVQSRDLPSGGRTGMTFSVTNTNQGPTPISITVNGNGFSCSGDCSPQVLLNPNDTKQFTVQLTAPSIGAGQTRTIEVQVNANGGGDNGQATQQFTVRGADKPRTVRQVTGRVKDQDGKSVPGANVGLRDSQGHTYTTTSNDEGRYQFSSSDQKPIVPGNLIVGATKEKYTEATVNVQGNADKTVNVPLTLQLKEAASSASPSPSASASPTAADEAADPATDAASPPPAADTQNAAQNNDSGSSTLFIILGALLVAAGIGAIVLLMMRRRGNSGDGPDDPDDIGGGPSGPVPPSQGRYNGLPDATRVAAPVGGRANDATMVARSGPSISDAPTMMQQAVPVDDEFPDPYGAPAVPGGYAGAGGYGTAPAAGGYGTATPYGAGPYGGAAVPAQPAGYDAGPPTQYGRPVPDDDPYGAHAAPAAGSYAAEQPRYDEPTGMYRPEYDSGGAPDDGYGYRGEDDGYAAPEQDYPRGGGQAPGGYQGGGYRGQQPDGYGSWGAPAGGIDSGNAYGPPAGSYAAGAYGGLSYGQPGGGSYDRGADEYDAGGPGGYDARGTYGGRSEPYDGGAGGHDQGGGSYGGDQYGDAERGRYYGGQDQGGGRHGGQSRPESPHPGQRRPLDWLDD